jgi:nucleotide-binding universal stress UspA family protein
MPGIQRILVPTDFSPASDLALQYAIDMAARLGSQIHVLHVVDDAGLAIAYPDGMYVPAMPELRERVMEEAADLMAPSVERCIAAGMMTTHEVLVGAPARVIAQTATSRGSDLIVMGTHGRGAFAHLLIGSVAERVVRIAPCAVLTVRDSSRIADVLAAERVAPHKAAHPA